jgi:hypothetical protein
VQPWTNSLLSFALFLCFPYHIIMLRPFRIRDLHQESVRQNLYDAETETTVSGVQHPAMEGSLSRPVISRHGTVHLSAPEYDDIVISHPRAALTYMDDDDGEMITVSSIDSTCLVMLPI